MKSLHNLVQGIITKDKKKTQISRLEVWIEETQEIQVEKL